MCSFFLSKEGEDEEEEEEKEKKGIYTTDYMRKISRGGEKSKILRQTC